MWDSNFLFVLVFWKLCGFFGGLQRFVVCDCSDWKLGKWWYLIIFRLGMLFCKNSSSGNYWYPLLKDTFESTRKSFYTLWCRMYINISVPWRFHADCKKSLVFFGGKMGFEANKIQGSRIRTTQLLAQKSVQNPPDFWLSRGVHWNVQQILSDRYQ